MADRVGMLTLRAPNGAELACGLADTFARRFLGLIGRRGLPTGTGLLFVPGGSIHTAFMRFPIDAVFIDRAGGVVTVAEEVKPWHGAAGHGARFVLELAAGEAQRLGISAGAQLEPAGGSWTWENLSRGRLPFLRRTAEGRACRPS
ncbi:MAG: DUF192 domain-containing protein [Gaiellaceae bacterium]